MSSNSTPIFVLCCLALCLGQEPDFDEVPGSFLSPDEFNFNNTENISEANRVEQILNEDLFEGDIIINSDDKQMLSESAPPVAGPRNVMQVDNKKWLNHKIPYNIVSTFTKEDRSTLGTTMRMFHTETCLRFIPHTDEEDYILIRLGDENSSEVGRTGGRQYVTLKRRLYLGTVAHELMHTLGFWHEHTRNDRDNYIRINWENIIPGMEHNFKKHEPNTVSDLGIGYDLGSIMHFGHKMFTNNKSVNTIEVLGQGIIGQRMYLSRLDVKKINKVYNCPQS